MRKIFILLVLSALIFQTTAAALAASFNPGLILTDEELTDANALNLDQIKNFLQKKGSFLTNYVVPSVKMYAYQIIYEVAQFYQISPKYILALLQKEQSLVTDTNPTQGQLDWATGYGCPDSGGCNDKHKGLATQIDWGAGAIRYYLDNAEKFNFKVNKTHAIDNQKITILNLATSALYNYTPHIHGNEVLHSLWNQWFALNYPEGSLLQNATDKTLWLIQNNQRRQFVSKAVFTSNYSLNKLLTIKAEDLEKYEIGAPIKYANYSLLQIPSGGVYFLENDTVRPITSKEAFKLIGFNPEEIIKISEEEVLSFPRGEPITVKSSYPVGAILQDKITKEIYFVKDGIKHLLVSDKLLKIYFPKRKIVKVTSEELSKYETGENYQLKDGELVKITSDPKVYVISEGKKLPIANLETFESMGYQWKNIIEVPETVLALHELGEEVNVVE